MSILSTQSDTESIHFSLNVSQNLCHHHFCLIQHLISSPVKCRALTASSLAVSNLFSRLPQREFHKCKFGCLWPKYFHYLPVSCQQSPFICMHYSPRSLLPGLIPSRSFEAHKTCSSVFPDYILFLSQFCTFALKCEIPFCGMSFLVLFLHLEDPASLCS